MTDAASGSSLEVLSAKVPQALLGMAARIGRSMRFAAGDTVFSAGERATGLHLVVSGAVRIVREGGDRAVVMHREAAGGLLGEVALFGDGVYPGTSVATEPTVVLLLPADALAAEMRSDPALAALFLSRLALRTREIIRRLDQLAHQTVLRRLAGFLLERHAQVDGGRAMSLGMTQPQLAEELGTVKEVVVRELRALRHLGVIEPAGRGLYRVINPAALRDLAGERDDGRPR